MNQESRITNHGKQKSIINSIIHDSLFIIHPRKGFTLLELLIVIAILGILSVSIITAINVIGNLNKASLATAKTFSGSVENALSINQVGKWSFEDGTGATTFKDTSGYNNNGSCSGGSCPTWKNATECGLGFGGCLEFILGMSHYISVTDTDSLRPSAVTVSAWIKTTQTNIGRIVVKPNIVNTNQAYSLNINGDTPDKARMYTVTNQVTHLQHQRPRLMMVIGTLL